MKYGSSEFIEEKDISAVHRKMIKNGAVWGCEYLNGFLESLNEKREPENRFTVLVRHPEECDFCDFAFAIKNRICAVVFDVCFWGSHYLSYERRMRLIEASFEHRLMPIVFNVIAGWQLDFSGKTEEHKFAFESADRWMTDPVSGITIFPDMGSDDDWKLDYPLDEWAAELYAKQAAKRALAQQGIEVVQMYPNNRFMWAQDGNGNPTWVLVSFHHAAVEGVPDYSGFDKNNPNVVGKAGYGIDVAISNTKYESTSGSRGVKPIRRSWDIAAEVVSITKLAEGVTVEAQNREVSVSTEDGPASEEREEDLYDEYGRLKKKPAKTEEQKPVEIVYRNTGRKCSVVADEDPAIAAKKAAARAKIAAMSLEEKLLKAKPLLEKELKANPNDEKSKELLKKVVAALAKYGK